MTRYNQAILETSGAYLGLQEWPGARHNPVVVGFFEASGHGWVKDDETPWCAAFIGAVLAQVGLKGTGMLNAKSYLDWGTSIPMSEALAGDIVILSRLDPDGPYGHVAILVGFDGDKAILRGGNQGNRVSDAPYAVGRIIGFRRAGLAAPDTGRPMLREGDRGMMVSDLQSQLYDLRYFAGRVDGIFGPLTAAAVRAFQNEAGLKPDGIVGPVTWAALSKAPPRAERDISAGDLRTSGSETMKSADAIDVVAGAGGVTATVKAVSDAADEAQGLLPTLEALITQHWPLLLVGAAVLGVLYYSNRIKVARLRDARSGAHVGR